MGDPEEIDLSTLNRADLNTYALDHGVSDPESYATKAELIAALESQESGDPGTSSPDSGADADAEAGAEEAPADAEPADAPAEAEPLTYEPLNPDDEEENPVAIKLPKTGEETAQEGTALAEAKSEQTGGEQPFTEEVTVTGERKWSLDAAHNVNDRQEGTHGFERPDLVEHTYERAQQG